MKTQQNSPSRTIGPKPKGSHTTVKVRMLEDTLEAFKSEIGHSLSFWFTKTVHPILIDFEARIAVLEWAVLPWYKKIWYRWKLSREKVQEAPPEPDEQPENEPETAVEQPPDDVPEEKRTRVCAKCGQMFIIHDQSRICPICRLKDV